MKTSMEQSDSTDTMTERSFDKSGTGKGGEGEGRSERSKQERGEIPSPVCTYDVEGTKPLLHGSRERRRSRRGAVMNQAI